MKILIIAGHGGSDPGAAYGHYKEASLTRDMARLIMSRLSEYCNVTLFNSEIDCYRFLANGGTYDFKPFGYVLEIHFNAGGGNGVEVLVHETEKGVSVEQNIAKNISALGFTNRGVKTRNNLLVQNTVKKKFGISHALLEVCFVDSPNDMIKYEMYKNQIADAVVKGIADGFGLKKAVPETPKTIDDPKAITEALQKLITISEPENFENALSEAKANESPLYWGLWKIVNK